MRIVPYTTRAKRVGETEGFDYFYIRHDQFQRMIVRNELTDWDFTVGNYYGYGLELFDRAKEGANAVVPVVARMALRLRARLPNIYLLFLDAPEEGRRVRVEARTPSDRERMLRDEHADEEREHSAMFDHVSTLPSDFGAAAVAGLIERAMRSASG